MSLNIFSLPQSVRASLFLEWTPLNDLAHLDSSFTTKSTRAVFLSDIAERYALKNEIETNFSKSFVSWIMTRKIYLSKFTLDSDNSLLGLKKYANSHLVDKVEVFSHANAESSTASYAAYLAGLPLLKEIHLTHSEHVTESTISGLLKMKNLSAIKVLNLSGIKLSTATYLKIIKTWPQLTGVTFSGSDVTDEVIYALTTGIESLKQINVSGVENLSSTSLIKLVTKHSLESIDISFCNQCDEALYEAIGAHCPDLTELKVEQYGDQYGEAPEFNAFLPVFTNCKKLRVLNLCKVNTWESDQKSTQALADNIHELRELNFDYFSHECLPDNLLEDIIRGNPRLTKISFRSVSCLDDTTIEALAETCPLLEELHFYFGRARSTAFVQLIESAGNSIRVLDLHSVDAGNKTFLAVAKHCPNLQEVNMMYSGVGKSGLLAVGEHCKKLRHMRVFKSAGSRADFDQIRKWNPKLEILHTNNDHDDSTGGGEDEEVDGDEFEGEDGEEGDDNEEEDGDGDDDDDDDENYDEDEEEEDEDDE